MEDRVIPEKVYDAEKKNSLEHFKKDPYGCKGTLKMKKEGRNPFRKNIPYPQGCPELAGLFSYCDRSIFAGKLPWRTKS